ncbi:uncharacterized protein LOC144645292 [Oculina patagonica]
MLVLIIGETQASLVLKASKVPGPPLYPGKTAFVYSSISHENPALNNMMHLVLEFKIPSYMVYNHYTSNGTRSPDDVTESLDGNFRVVTLKFNKLLTSEHVGVKIAVNIHQDDGFGDDSFHHASCVVNLRYQIESPCASACLTLTELAMTQITFYSPACPGFGPLGQSPGGTKDSQITASSSQNETFLPYSSKLEADLSTGWIPLRASEGVLHDVHFIQVDLREIIQTKFLFAVQGLSPKIPKEKIFLVHSEDGLEWKEAKRGIVTAVDPSAGSTVTVMKSLKFPATARFVRVILPPFQKPGGEQPVYKVELYGCPDDGITKGKVKKVPVPVAVGMESGVIADNQLTSSSEQGPEYGAQYSRLNSQSGGGAWCAGSCDSSEYLQIDLGQVYLISELDVQSKHDESGNTTSVLSFYFEYSADGASWVYYTANAANKLFLGSPLRNLAVRHKLLFPVFARFVRFRPKTCIGMACMRVELYWYPDSGPQSQVIFGRSFLLEESSNTIFVCNTDVKKSESPCKGSTDGGQTWRDLEQKIINVIGYDPNKDTYFGISSNKKTLTRSKFSPFTQWIGAGLGIWKKAKESSSLITATEVPFIPVLPGNLDEPYDALTEPSSSVSLKRRRRSVASVDMWGSSSKGFLYKPSGAIDWKMVSSWIDYPYDIKVDCLALPCNHGTCAKTPNGGYTCNCYPGYFGEHCDQDICDSNPCLYGGTCVVSSDGGYTCECTFFQSGQHCELGVFYCQRLPSYFPDGPYWPNSGKFDKIAFSLSADHNLLGISIGQTVQLGLPVNLTIKVTDISGGIIASKTIQHTFNSVLTTVYFDHPILLTAGQQYIAASLVEEATSLPEMIKFGGGSEILTCGNPLLTITFADAPSGEWEDSNKSTVQEGQILYLDFKSA